MRGNIGELLEFAVGSFKLVGLVRQVGHAGPELASHGLDIGSQLHDFTWAIDLQLVVDPAGCNHPRPRRGPPAA
jgi:hypothetical protein